MRWRANILVFLVFLGVSLAGCRSDQPLRLDDKALADTLGMVGKSPSLSDDNGVAARTFGEDLKLLTHGELLAVAERTQEEVFSNREEALLLGSLNMALCERMNRMFRECPAQRRLMDEASALKELQCGETKDVTDALGGVIEVELEGDLDKKVVLVANSIYESSAFGSGKSQIVFHAAGKADTVSIKFSEVTRLSVQAEEKGAKLGNLGGRKIRLLVDGSLLFESTLRLPEDKGASGHEYDVHLANLVKLVQSSECQISEKEINELKGGVREKVEKESDQQLKVLKSLADAELESKVIKWRSEIAASNPQLEAARDRQFKLSNELRSEKGVGCHLQEPIRDFAVEVGGSLVDRTLWKNQKNQVTDHTGAGGSSELKIDMGGLDFKVDLRTKNIFGARYVYPNEIASSVVLSSLKRVTFRKMGQEYDNVQRCNNGIIFGIGRKCSYDIYEMNIITLDSIAVFVNGLRVFSAKDLKVRLDRNQSEFMISNLETSQDWIAVSQRRDCAKTE